jgi:hypothetical protein
LKATHEVKATITTYSFDTEIKVRGGGILAVKETSRDPLPHAGLVLEDHHLVAKYKML